MMDKKDCLKIFNKQAMEVGDLERLLHGYIERKKLSMTSAQKDKLFRLICLDWSLREQFIKNAVLYFCRQLNIVEVYIPKKKVVFYV